MLVCFEGLGENLVWSPPSPTLPCLHAALPRLRGLYFLLCKIDRVLALVSVSRSTEAGEHAVCKNQSWASSLSRAAKQYTRRPRASMEGCLR